MNKVKLKYLVYSYFLPPIFLSLLAAVFRLDSDIFEILLAPLIIITGEVGVSYFKKKIIKNNQTHLIGNWIWLKGYSIKKVLSYVPSFLIYYVFFDIFTYLLS